MKKDDLKDEARAELEALAEKPEEEIRLDDIPEVVDWRGAVRGRFYRPIKKSISIRLDADVIAWFQSMGGKYQSRINEVLRHYMLERLGEHR
jgi:uncharacterized protein (DUF4415 family)